MTQEEKTRLDKMEHSLNQIEKDVLDIKSAILGNPLSGEKGLAGQINLQNAKIELLENEVKKLTEERVKNSIYVRLITWLLAVIGAGIAGFFFDLFKHNTK